MSAFRQDQESMSAAGREERQLAEGLGRLGLEVPVEVRRRLLAYTALLRKWSSAYNLVSADDLPHFVSRHLLDSLAILPMLPEGAVLDVGSGAGLPGLPVAMVRPGTPVTLLDAARKRARFLRFAVRDLGLANVEVVEGRVEDYAPGAPPDIVVSRAFASLSRFVRAVEHLAGGATRLYAIKGRRPEEELHVLPKRVRVEAVLEYTVPDLHAERHLVIMSLSPPTA